jgi:hypothetical protein
MRRGPARWRELSDFDRGWVVGILEGEGSFVKTDRSSKGAVRLQCKMTDFDTMQRLADLLGANLLGPYANNCETVSGEPRKPFWAMQISGKRSHSLIRHIAPFLSERRRARIIELLGDNQDELAFD